MQPFLQGFVRGAVLALHSWHNVVAVRAGTSASSSGSLQAIVYAGKDPLTGKERYLRGRRRPARPPRWRSRDLLDPGTIGLLTAYRELCESRCAAPGVEFDPR